MKINLNISDIKLLKSLFEEKENNIQISMMLNYLLENINYFNKSEIHNYQKEYNCSLDKAFFHYAIDIWELDFENEENKKFFKDYLNDSFKKQNEEEYKNNPFYKLIKPREIKNSDYHLFYDSYQPYEPFPLDDIKVTKPYIENTTFGYFENEFKFLTLNYKNITWMSITPNEINTMKKDIEMASGNVLVLGLGLGYFPFMISLKNNVKSIQIIEKDQQIINIFKKEILPLFPNKNKINIVKDDAINYVSKYANKYDFVYVDLYHNPVDGLSIYCKIKELEKEKEFHYWLEEGILAYLRRLIITIMQENMDGLNDSNYQKEENEEDSIINKIYFITKEKEFNSFNEIFNYLSNASLTKLSKILFKS